MGAAMDDIRKSECKKCREQIMWTVTRNNKRMALDAEPAPGGKFIIEPTGEKAGEFMAVVAPKRYSGPRFTCHFETCTAKG